MKYSLILIGLICIPAQCYAKQYTVNHDTSSITFSGTHLDKTFTGHFAKWDADIDFDAEHLKKSTLSVTIQTQTASTGEALYDGTLPTSDWFHTDTYPTAQFTSKTISKNADGTFTAQGNLTIRNITKPLTFTFDVTSHNNARTAKTKFTLPINRLDYDIGKGSDPKAEWVSNTINVAVSLDATYE